MAGLRHKRAFAKKPEVADAIIAINDNSVFSINMDDLTSLNWLNPNIPKPTNEEILAKLEELKEEYNKQLYRWERYQEYLTVEEQLALLWDDMEAGNIPGKETSEWFNHIKQVKENNPKPTE